VTFHDPMPGMRIPTIVESWPHPKTLRGWADYDSLSAIIDKDVSGLVK
jgi:hypothetical protein